MDTTRRTEPLGQHPKKRRRFDGNSHNNETTTNRGREGYNSKSRFPGHYGFSESDSESDHNVEITNDDIRVPSLKLDHYKLYTDPNLAQEQIDKISKQWEVYKEFLEDMSRYSKTPITEEIEKIKDFSNRKIDEIDQEQNQQNRYHKALEFMKDVNKRTIEDLNAKLKNLDPNEKPNFKRSIENMNGKLYGIYYEQHHKVQLEELCTELHEAGASDLYNTVKKDIDNLNTLLEQCQQRTTPELQCNLYKAHSDKLNTVSSKIAGKQDGYLSGLAQDNVDGMSQLHDHLTKVTTDNPYISNFKESIDKHLSAIADKYLSHWHELYTTLKSARVLESYTQNLDKGIKELQELSNDYKAKKTSEDRLDALARYKTRETEIKNLAISEFKNILAISDVNKIQGIFDELNKKPTNPFITDYNPLISDFKSEVQKLIELSNGLQMMDTFLKGPGMETLANEWNKAIQEWNKKSEEGKAGNTQSLPKAFKDCIQNLMIKNPEKLREISQKLIDIVTNPLIDGHPLINDFKSEVQNLIEPQMVDEGLQKMDTFLKGAGMSEELTKEWDPAIKGWKENFAEYKAGKANDAYFDNIPSLVETFRSCITGLVKENPGKLWEIHDKLKDVKNSEFPLFHFKNDIAETYKNIVANDENNHKDLDTMYNLLNKFKSDGEENSLKPLDDNIRKLSELFLNDIFNPHDNTKRNEYCDLIEKCKTNINSLLEKYDLKTVIEINNGIQDSHLKDNRVLNFNSKIENRLEKLIDSNIREQNQELKKFVEKWQEFVKKEDFTNNDILNYIDNMNTTIGDLQNKFGEYETECKENNRLEEKGKLYTDYHKFVKAFNKRHNEMPPDLRDAINKPTEVLPPPPPETPKYRPLPEIPSLTDDLKEQYNKVRAVYKQAWESITTNEKFVEDLPEDLWNKKKFDNNIAARKELLNNFRGNPPTEITKENAQEKVVDKWNNSSEEIKKLEDAWDKLVNKHEKYEAASNTMSPDLKLMFQELKDLIKEQGKTIARLEQELAKSKKENAELNAKLVAKFEKAASSETEKRKTTLGVLKKIQGYLRHPFSRKQRKSYWDNLREEARRKMEDRTPGKLKSDTDDAGKPSSKWKKTWNFAKKMYAKKWVRWWVVAPTLVGLAIVGIAPTHGASLALLIPAYFTLKDNKKDKEKKLDPEAEI